MSTFAEIAETARLNRPPTGTAIRMIAELAEALDRFEYNTARALHQMRRSAHDVGMNLPYSTQEWLNHLRAEVPEGVSD